MFERQVERLILASRWLQLPLYLGLAIALLFVVVRFFVDFWRLTEYTWQGDQSGFVPAVLALVDIVLVANLIVVVVISGYENYVSQLDADAVQERLSWFGKLDSGSIKIKLAMSIVAISSIHLLKAFVDALEIDNDKLIILMAMHLVFVVSALLLVCIDRFAAPAKPAKTAPAKE